jgi:CBS domain-containing protein
VLLKEFEKNKVEAAKLLSDTESIFFLKVMPTVKELMTRNVLTLDIQKTVFEAAELMTQKEVGDVVVTEGEIPRGIVTERDFVMRVVAKRRPLDAQVSEIMSRPLITIDVEASLKEAARKMVNNRIRRLPVLKDHKLVGILVVSDFAKHLSKKTLTEGILEAIWRYPVT